jgi:enamine deaminase RidA (YjgF/YER057c/UK114 family)
MMASAVEYIDPRNTAPAQGLYSHVGVAPAGKTLFIAGQLSVGRSGEIVGVGDFDAQFRQIFANLGDVLSGMNLDFRNVVKFTTLFTRASDIDSFMRLRAETFPGLFGGNKYPPNTILVIHRLVKPEFLLEIEAVASSE